MRLKGNIVHYIQTPDAVLFHYIRLYSRRTGGNGEWGFNGKAPERVSWVGEFMISRITHT